MHDTPQSFDVNYTTAIEMMIIIAMEKWHATAPKPGQYGCKGDKWLENSQQVRLQYLLQLIGATDSDRIYGVIELKTRRSSTHESSVTSIRPAQPLTLNDHWYLDGCLNLGQKLDVVSALIHLGFSGNFLAMAKNFVAGDPLVKIRSNI
jgi:hypothetical protein